MSFKPPHSRGSYALHDRARPQASLERVPWFQALQRRAAERFGRHEGTDGILNKIAHSLAAGTAKSYGGHWQRFVLWCEDQSDQPNPLPAEPETVIRWLETDVTVGDRVAEQSLQPYLSGINKIHEDLGYERPALGILLKSYRKGLARLQGLKRKPARTYLPPPVVEELLLWALDVDLTNPTASLRRRYRAAVAVVFTFCFFARGGTGSALLNKHVRSSAAGTSVTLAHEKGRAGKKTARVIVIPPGAIPGLEELLQRWTQLRGCAKDHESFYSLEGERLRPPSTAIDTWLQECLLMLDASAPDGETWSGHSLRKGAASGASARGVSLDRICYVGGWSIQSKAVWDYIDPTCPDSAAACRFFGWLRPA